MNFVISGWNFTSVSNFLNETTTQIALLKPISIKLRSCLPHNLLTTGARSKPRPTPTQLVELKQFMF